MHNDDHDPVDWLSDLLIILCILGWLGLVVMFIDQLNQRFHWWV